MTNIDLQESCWTVAQKPRPNGYIQINIKGKMVRLHRLMYETFINDIPKGLVIDHLCKEPSCCNPKHLEAVTQAENIRRGDAGLYQKIKTHCPKGHEYTCKNTGYYKNSRTCKVCKKNRDFERNQNKRLTLS